MALYRQLSVFCSLGFGLSLSLSCGCSVFQTETTSYFGKPEKSIESTLALAQLCERHADTKRANELYYEILLREPKNVEAQHRLAVIAAREQNYSEAEKLFEQALKFSPQNANLYNDFGFAYYLQDKLEDAARHFQKAIELKPDFKAAWTNLGLVYGHQGRFSECREVFSKAADTEADVHCNMAYVFAQAKKLELAQNEYQAALQADPECAVAAEGLLQVSSRIPGQAPMTVASTFGSSRPNSTATSIDSSATEANLGTQLLAPKSGIPAYDNQEDREYESLTAPPKQ